MESDEELEAEKCESIDKESKDIDNEEDDDELNSNITNSSFLSKNSNNNIYFTESQLYNM
jgi:hypothetical protein